MEIHSHIYARIRAIIQWDRGASGTFRAARLSHDLAQGARHEQELGLQVVGQLTFADNLYEVDTTAVLMPSKLTAINGNGPTPARQAERPGPTSPPKTPGTAPAGPEYESP